MVTKHDFLIFVMCSLCFLVGVYINVLHDVAVETPGNLRRIGRSVFDKFSSLKSVGPSLELLSSRNTSWEQGVLVRVSDALSFITGMSRIFSLHSVEILRHLTSVFICSCFRR
jgi:hypothetical protein